MTRRFIAFVRGLSTTWVGTIGVALTTTAFVLFLGLELLRVLGVLTNAYVGLITYLTLPAIFVIGLLLIPIGWLLYRRASRRNIRDLVAERFESKMSGRAFLAILGGLTLVNLLFLGAGAARMLRFMDQPEFCGTACHSVMGPEWAAYQRSSHARVPCVDCHVGDGAGALVDSKINGMRQLFSLMFDRYERPIPTPVGRLRSADDTCGSCHFPERARGDVLRTFVSYDLDRASTPRYTTLALKVGPDEGRRASAIHWHATGEARVRYASLDGERETITWVVVEEGDGSSRRYVNRRIAVPWSREVMRAMDCVDCHNRVGHDFEDPERAIDRLIAAGAIDRALPFAKRAALSALVRNYPDREAADLGIEARLAGFYADGHARETQSQQDQIDRAVAALREVHRQNVHHGMRVLWNAYADHRGHRGDEGCFRCHNRDLVDADGNAIPSDCTFCHSMLSWDSERPFQFLEKPDDDDPESDIHLYLQREYLKGTTAPSAGQGAREPSPGD